MQSVDETYDVYDETATKARIAHTCRACDEVIPANTIYIRVNIVFQGSAETLKRCGRCQAIHEYLREHGDNDRYEQQWPDEELNCGETYEDVFGGPPPEHIAAMAFMLPTEFPETQAGRKTRAWRERKRLHREKLKAEKETPDAE